MPSSPSLEAFTAQFVFRFIFTGGFCFLASSIPFVLALLERFESQLTETASLCLDLQLSHRSPSQNRIAVTPSTWVIDLNRFRETHEQLATFLPIQFQLDSA